MGLLKHPKNKRYQNSNLNNPAKINIKHELSPDDIHVSHKKNHNTEKQPKTKRVTTSETIRCDNHIRNDISALIQLGYGKSNKGLVSQLVQNKIEQLDSEQYKRFNYLRNILETKDALNYQIKHHR